MSTARLLTLCAALALGVFANGCSYRYQGEPVPQAPSTLPASTPIAATAKILYSYDGNPWRGPFSWDQIVREELDASELLGVAGLGHALRIDVTREIDTPVWKYVLHWLTVFMFPRSAELTLSVRATLLGPRDVELTSREVSSTVEAQASLLFLVYPPAWSSWSAKGAGHENPLVLKNIRELTRCALAALAQDLRPKAPRPKPPADDPPTNVGDPPSDTGDPPGDTEQHAAYCTECGQALQATWKHCPSCGTATRSGD